MSHARKLSAASDLPLAPLAKTLPSESVPIPLALLANPGTISTYEDEMGVYMCVWIRAACSHVSTGAPALQVVATGAPPPPRVAKYTCGKCGGQGHQARTCGKKKEK